MRLLEAYVENFGSYDQLTIDFSNLGLSLIYGKTGSGKSTIPDIACWLLTGKTAKDGNADEVRSWFTQEPTSGRLSVQLQDGEIEIYRTRGKGGSDLFWIETDGSQKRGKDLTETQKLLNQRLGIDPDLYLSAAYFCEFSPSGQFFLSKPKDKRELFERIAHLDLPVRIAQRATEVRKELRKTLQERQQELSKAQGRLEQLETAVKANKADSEEWQKHQAKVIKDLEGKFKGYDLEKRTKIEALRTKSDHWAKTMAANQDAVIAKIEANTQKLEPLETLNVKLHYLTSNPTRCSECGGVSEEYQNEVDDLKGQISQLEKLADKTEDLKSRLRELTSEENPYEPNIAITEESPNPYGAQLDAELSRANPYTARGLKAANDLESARNATQELGCKVVSLEYRFDALVQLQDLSMDLRAQLVQKAVREIQESTNAYLERYFDGEIRVSFTPEGSDGLSVAIQKSGYDCVYKQLSKGQRQMLKLCFGVSVMKASANRAGIHFGQIFFDESLDGLSEEMKVKAFGLFEQLESEHETVMVIDHAPEFQNLFSTKFKVTMEGDISKVERES